MFPFDDVIMFEQADDVFAFSLIYRYRHDRGCNIPLLKTRAHLSLVENTVAVGRPGVGATNAILG